MALAGQEMEKRLATTVGGLRRGLADARSLHASLRAEAAELESFVPVLIQGAVSGIHDALRQQVSPAAGNPLSLPLHGSIVNTQKASATAVGLVNILPKWWNLVVRCRSHKTHHSLWNAASAAAMPYGRTTLAPGSRDDSAIRPIRTTCSRQYKGRPYLID